MVLHSSPFQTLAMVLEGSDVCSQASHLFTLLIDDVNQALEVFLVACNQMLSSAYLMLLIFCPPTLTPGLPSIFRKIISLYKENKSGDKTHPCLTPLLIGWGWLSSLSTLMAAPPPLLQPTSHSSSYLPSLPLQFSPPPFPLIQLLSPPTLSLSSPSLSFPLPLSFPLSLPPLSLFLLLFADVLRQQTPLPLQSPLSPPAIALPPLFHPPSCFLFLPHIPPPKVPPSLPPPLSQRSPPPPLSIYTPSTPSVHSPLPSSVHPLLLNPLPLSTLSLPPSIPPPPPSLPVLLPPKISIELQPCQGCQVGNTPTYYSIFYHCFLFLHPSLGNSHTPSILLSLFSFTLPSPSSSFASSTLRPFFLLFFFKVSALFLLCLPPTSLPPFLPLLPPSPLSSPSIRFSFHFPPFSPSSSLPLPAHFLSSHTPFSSPIRFSSLTSYLSLIPLIPLTFPPPLDSFHYHSLFSILSSLFPSLSRLSLFSLPPFSLTFSFTPSPFPSPSPSLSLSLSLSLSISNCYTKQLAI
ncbi:hypothetical protein C7M84_022394 [Penaeus vannamei]|uniref:Uncharacterized protein n=1 Tax=Penaeus vannamei TaxID=6689 RepID=A0A3R7PW29_PENVA|nr:hypothetical protein C7M84_022394 [Penaeus vannamei]